MFKKIVLGLLAIIVVAGVVFALGPREPVDETVRFTAADLGDDLDAYLANRESVFEDITPGAQKQIVWADPATKAKTPLSVIYIHGFSATLEEVRPLPDIIAKELGANLYYTRLAGHGRSGDAMGTPSVNDWFIDTVEALEIGRKLGDKVVILSTSTGGTLATWAASKPALMKDVLGSVMLSPNYAVQAAGSEALSLPWARHLLPLAFGKDREWEPRNAEQRKWWSTKYPNVALLPMQASVNTANAVSFENIAVPAMFIYHPDDGVVKSDVTRTLAARWGKNTGAKTEVFEVAESTDTHKHVIAGRILSPENTQPLADRAIAWIKSL